MVVRGISVALFWIMGATGCAERSWLNNDGSASWLDKSTLCWTNTTFEPIASAHFCPIMPRSIRIQK